MLQPKKIPLLSAMVLTCMTAAGPAAAFRLSTPAPAADNQPGLAAYTTGASDASADHGMLLSPDEISHIRWCATRYMSYHPTENNYATANGKRQECQSPAAR